ncbi:cyclic peptide export ABC transporter [Paraflavitalea soli]|uniref:Cyclic peptide export ABC transporter n=1 Tax=Paraflavitalea soli TaxID=2315862 RepID=A0A3B7MT60_9BACT|nr:cyclic peptide export ABC transporter [Paraflavitalea soli]AXY73681.1 cyclic peptide export ABC transporter [Paraflavitalea soli]
MKLKTCLLMFAVRRYIGLIPGAMILYSAAFAQAGNKAGMAERIEQEVTQYMSKGHIPGLSVVLIDHDSLTIRSFGYADLVTKTPVNASTVFELGSCSKAFTAMAIYLLEQQGRLQLDASVNHYIPWFQVKYKGAVVPVTIRQLLHHTSGIPWHTIAGIPVSDSDTALQQTVRNVTRVELDHLPGNKYEYATINYDILALVAQTVTGQLFEAFMQASIFDALGLNSTSIGQPRDGLLKSAGYKIGFFAARRYQAPVYRGNYAAGYVLSNATDMASWLKFQLGLAPQPLYELIGKTQQRDESVAAHDNAFYASGWQVALDGTGELLHDGLNPNFSSYIAFRPKEQLGVVVLANSNSPYTPVIGNKLIKMLAHEKVVKEYDPGDNGDSMFSGIALAVGVYLLAVLACLVWVIRDIIKKTRQFAGFSLSKLLSFGKALVLIVPFLYGIYQLPQWLLNFNWEAVLVWQPVSLEAALVLLAAAIPGSYLVYLLSLLFPEENPVKRRIPSIVLLTILSGLSNVLLIIFVTSAMDTEIKIRYLFFYYLLIIGLYLMGRRFVQISLIKITRGIVYELRVKLINKIFSTDYEKFESIDRGKVYTALNDDANVIGESTTLMISLITSTITVIGAFLYLMSLAFWATLLTSLIIVSIAVVYYFVTRSANTFYNEARDSRNVFMRLINGMIDGYKELSLHRQKKVEYQEDVRESAHQYKIMMSAADIRFTNAFLVGESLLVVLLGAVSIGMPKLFPGITTDTITSFIIVLLYLIGPVNAILNNIPDILRVKIGWERIRKFIQEIPASPETDGRQDILTSAAYKFEARGISFQYGQGGFGVGPIDLEVQRGEILFITGGNGSGKTTLAKMLTGLYPLNEGAVLINDKVQQGSQIGEYFSVVFNPTYLFEKLYNVDLADREQDLKDYLGVLDLQQKVEIRNNRYSTIKLSGGQRKRLALLQCYLEDKPIYLFDEWAADQDPSYRKFFYRTMLPDMKRAGKIIIAITHDDHYFDVADKLIKLDKGQLDHIKDLEATVH